MILVADMADTCRVVEGSDVVEAAESSIERLLGNVDCIDWWVSRGVVAVVGAEGAFDIAVAGRGIVRNGRGLRVNYRETDLSDQNRQTVARCPVVKRGCEVLRVGTDGATCEEDELSPNGQVLLSSRLENAAGCLCLSPCPWNCSVRICFS